MESDILILLVITAALALVVVVVALVASLWQYVPAVKAFALRHVGKRFDKGKSVKVPAQAVKIKFAKIKPGAFMMGSPESEKGHDETETLHHVTVTAPFMMGIVPITKAQFSRFISSTKYRTSAEIAGFSYVVTTSGVHAKNGVSWRDKEAKSDDAFPVVNVSWHDADAFCKWASRIGKKTVRLPTEAEWEYACRAGTTTPFAGTRKLDDMGWYGGNSGRSPIDCQALLNQGRGVYFQTLAKHRCQRHAAGLKRANAWGLFDMHGNIWEWCFDVFEHYPATAMRNPIGPIVQDPKWRIMRGGMWADLPETCRSANRGYFHPNDSFATGGFRVVCEMR